MKGTRCYICGAAIEDIEGPVSEKAYLPQSPGCWKLFTEIMEREYGEWEYPDVHRLTVDCYAAQHPTKEPNEKSAQSIAVHLAAIYLTRVKKMGSKEVTGAMGDIVARYKGSFIWLEPPNNLGEVTVTDVRRAKDLEEHIVLVNAWADVIWNSWAPHQEYILTFIDA